MKQLREWLAIKSIRPDKPLFSMSGRVLGGVERKTHKRIESDLKAARQAWFEESKDSDECLTRIQSDFLRYRNHDGLCADFHGC